MWAACSSKASSLRVISVPRGMGVPASSVASVVVLRSQEEGVFAGLSPLCAGSNRCSSFKVDFTLRAITRDPHNPRCTAQTQDL